MNLKDISWPIFRLGQKTPIVKDGKTFFHKQYIEKDGVDIKDKYLLVDDIELPGDTLGRRRMHIPIDIRARINTAIYFLGDFLKLAKPTTWFIDSAGKSFKYKKTSRAKLRCFEISQVMPTANTGAIIVIKGLSQRFKTMYYPEDTYRYAGLLQYGRGYILYGLYNEPFKITNRAV